MHRKYWFNGGRTLLKLFLIIVEWISSGVYWPSEVTAIYNVGKSIMTVMVLLEEINRYGQEED